MKEYILEDVASEIRDSTKNIPSNTPIVGLEHLDSGDLMLHRWAVGINTTFTRTYLEKDILFGRRRAYLQKAVVAPNAGICSGDITVIRAKEDKICPELLPFIIQNPAFFDYAVKNSDGSLSPRVKWEHLKKYKFYLPDLDKQEEMAELLWAIEKDIEACKNLLNKNELYLDVLFKESIEECDRILKIRDCCSANKKGLWGNDAKENAKKVLKTNNMNYNGTIDYTEVVERDIDDVSFNKNMLEYGDILIEKCGGTKDHSVGYACFFDNDGEYVSNNFILVLSPNSTVNSYFMFYQLKYMYQIGDFSDCYGKTTGIQNLKVNRYLDKTIYLPSLDIQEKFSNRAKKTISLSNMLNENIELLKTAKTSIIKELLEGGR